MERVSRAQACRFLLWKNGLLGERRFSGKQGAVGYVHQAGCVSFDSIDICGCSHELALLARVKGFSREMLNQLLYQDRALLDAYDKNLCILCTEDWPMMAFQRETFRRYVRPAVENVAAQVMQAAMEQGCLSARETGGDALARAALESLFFQGKLVVHHQENGLRYYAPAESCLPEMLLNAPNPFPNDQGRLLWQVERRIGAVGLMWNVPSDAWLGINGLNAQKRQLAFQVLANRGRIIPVQTEGISLPLFVLSQDLPALKACNVPISMEKRARLLPPLDALLWDRRLIAALFGFSYKWEMYTPPEQQRYGSYVLPVLYGEGFLGRVEPVTNRETGMLEVRAFWPETDVQMTARCLWAMEDELTMLSRMLGLKGLRWQKDWMRTGEQANFVNH